MKKPSETIVFFGSGPVAAKSLQFLASIFEIEAVVTKPRPTHHKGDFPVLDVVDELRLKKITVTDKASLDELINIERFKSKLGVIVDFGIIVSQKVIDNFPLGILNSHFSLLPEWRGADPISYAILSGQKQTGVSVMLLVEKLDEGPLLAQAPFDIPSDFTTPQLTEALVDLSNQNLKFIIPKWLNGEIEAMPQDKVTIAASPKPSYSQKLSKDDGIIDWHKSAEVLEREIRAYIEWPKSRAKLADLDVIITEAHATPGQKKHDAPGKILVLNNGNDFAVTTGDGSLVIDKLKPAGKQDMTAKAFLAGYKNRLIK
ncbi:MAG TPA: methionyl-tRNA formyltransferase [Candidatus Saccharimonadales bacterium]|nr:methionyl-tRNA formyltransferase [Candidatus Saccharimonadales bacterium]